ncbi:hypothetical protein COT12_01705 [Candidatus Berkelbacteria bacterium CG08_land_8_20_14_0_20_39_8]|uniref:Uncharacterized protein n=1 Tax=Candidatus Berkelbacteria bacterium CG08_land_8_20_14_0_20_39_8 TaxID=1974511 RepID=A0A2M6YC94_9BACT|nr:MAG: hypothetical protein COT12_01705 [Candidatus Berkelbacteria bacterium CG08_land_8_20_14_0_20_39_8]
MKFLAFFFAVIVLFSSFFVALNYNLHQMFLTPEKTKEVLIKVNFYSQIKSVLKKDLFETGVDARQVSDSSKAIAASFDQFDFQPSIEKLISDFYRGLKSRKDFVLKIDLTDFKNVYVSNLLSGNKKTVEEISVSIPSSWQVDMSPYSKYLSTVALMYNNFNLILIVYTIMTLLFLIFCLLVSFKYLKLFFSVFLIVGIFLLVELVLWKVVNFSSLLSDLTSQGRSGLETLVENFINYFRQSNINLLFWEAIYLIVPSIIGLIVVSLIPTKVKNIPLHESK